MKGLQLQIKSESSSLFINEMCKNVIEYNQNQEEYKLKIK